MFISPSNRLPQKTVDHLGTGPGILINGVYVHCITMHQPIHNATVANGVHHSSGFIFANVHAGPYQHLLKLLGQQIRHIFTFVVAILRDKNIVIGLAVPPALLIFHLLRLQRHRLGHC
jgi:hypothetical protein